MSCFEVQEKTINMLASTILDVAEYDHKVMHVTNKEGVLTGNYYPNRTPYLKIYEDINVNNPVVYGRSKNSIDNIQNLAKKMLELNLKSINHCYKDSKNKRYDDTIERLECYNPHYESTMKVFKFLVSLNCYLYQSCEYDTEDKESHKLYTLLDNIRNELSQQLITFTTEYKAEEWE